MNIRSLQKVHRNRDCEQVCRNFKRILCNPWNVRSTITGTCFYMILILHAFHLPLQFVRFCGTGLKETLDSFLFEWTVGCLFLAKGVDSCVLVLNYCFCCYSSPSVASVVRVVTLSLACVLTCAMTSGFTVRWGCKPLSTRKVLLWELKPEDRSASEDHGTRLARWTAISKTQRVLPVC